MTSLNDFIKLEKYNSLVYFDMGMGMRSYSLWSSFLLPDGADEGEVESYTAMRITGCKDVYRLFSLSLAECAVDNQKKIDGVMRFDFVPLCRNPADFVNAVKELDEKRQKNMIIDYYLGLDSEKEPNLFLVDSFFESGLFAGTALSVKSADSAEVKKASEILSLTKKFGKVSKISVPLLALKKILSVSEPGKLQIVNPEFDKEMIELMRGNGFPAIFTVSSEPNVIRKYFDAGVSLSFASEKYLVCPETLSGFALRLFSSGLFSCDEIKKIFSASL